MSDEKSAAPSKNNTIWLVYLSLLISGILLLSDAYHLTQLQRWTARIGIALVFSAVALYVGNGRKTGFIAVIIMWLTIAAIYLI